MDDYGSVENVDFLDFLGLSHTPLVRPMALKVDKLTWFRGLGVDGDSLHLQGS